MRNVIGEVHNELTIVSVFMQANELYQTKFLCICTCGQQKITSY